jgi:hypothetical protein
MTDKMSNRRMPENMSNRISGNLLDIIPENMPKDILNRIPEDMLDRMPEDLLIRKCINIMEEIIRNKIIKFLIFLYNINDIIDSKFYSNYNYIFWDLNLICI